MSLVELLVAITLLGLTGTAVLGALAITTKGSSTSRYQAASMLWLQSSADYVATGQVPYQASCGADQTFYQSKVQDFGPASSAGWDKTNITVLSVRYWDGTTFGLVCSTDVNINSIQELTLRVTEPKLLFSAQLVIVKRKA
jgi:Tfp pilus assembly protein PilV